MADLPAPAHPSDSRATTEAQLRSAEQRLAFHVENTPLAVIEWDHEVRVTRWNAQAERMFGWAAQEVIGKSLYECPFVLEENIELARRMMKEAATGGLPRSTVTTANRTKDGRVVWCEWYNSTRYDDAGRMASTLSLGLDVSDRRASAEALALSQARLLAALDGAQMLAWDLDLITNRWETTLGIPDFYGADPGGDYSNPELALQVVHPDDLPIVLEGRRRAIEADVPMAYEFRGRAPAADGLPRWFSTRGRVLRDAAGAPVRIVAVTSDVTARKRSEEEREVLNRQLQDAQRWESLGVLAGGVAHDFNNILTVVLGSAGLARRGVAPGSPTLGYLDQIEQACRRAADVCRQMLAYAGRAQGSGARTQLSALVRESARRCSTRPPHATVRLDLNDRLPAVAVDPAQVRQVLINLATNAAEATAEKGGEILVRTHADEVADGESDSGFQLAPAPGRYVLLTVADTGSGMAPDVRARMFDPFFTTRFPGRGLGLAAVLGIVRAHKGGIRVETAPNRGTAVTVYWPACASDAPPAPALAPRPAPRKGPLALVIDDEMFVREVTASTLEEMGFTALLAADGPSGLSVFREHGEAIKLAVIDVMMPGMTGDQVLEELRGTAPALPVVLVSGFTDRRVLKVGFGTRTEFLQKPFHPEDLMAIVRRLT
ncbi:hybrid sensor histidine kinase/response regulator [Frigoriglobus tundricola]|uniref:histidine kinase n=1 Tax=Frigoriglobus tundricola TaxID=2774151 RepID=A0A6M5Z2H4_9BACT|nr:PAS domain S-box protein [Frigoriglobus tundricola]QJW99770.1 hypothetical protein FTUN_7393 [Frigoriglobus tundricola]